jgi:SAM-dependent methyltransferase
VTPEDCWLETTWSFVQGHVPPPPARVLEVGCGPRGGFVPALLQDGYDAVGVDPAAPAGPAFHQIELERYAPSTPMDTIVACTSLHHVADLATVLDHVVDALAPGGTVVIIEWASERFDEATARWCFDRLGAPAEPTQATWLHRHRAEWTASGRTWDEYRQDWAAGEGLHTGDEMLRALQARFRPDLVAATPYFSCDLASTTGADEQAAIDAGVIQATGLVFVGTLDR